MIVFIYILLSPIVSVSTLHDFHVSKCEIFSRSESRSLEITQHIFVDDLEVALAEAFDAQKLHIGTKMEKDSSDYFIEAYLQSHFSISLNNSNLEYNYLGKEMSEDLTAIWIYMEVPNFSGSGEIAVMYDVLFETFDDQKNIVSIKSDDGFNKMGLLHRGKSELTVSMP